MMPNSLQDEPRYKLLFDLAADAILTGDASGNITDANRRAAELSGYSREELFGQSIRLLFSADEQNRSPLRFDLVDAGKEVQTERLLSRKDGSTVPISMNSKKMPDGRYHTTIRDITHQKRLEEQLKATNRELEAFVYTISHDLRTPLTTIIGFTDYLRNHSGEALGTASLDALMRIEQAGEGMLATMEALLALATAGNLQRPEQAVDLNKLLTKIGVEKKQQLAAAGVSLRTAPLPSLHVPETFLMQIFNNLIGNAIIHAGKHNRCIEVGGDHHQTGASIYVRDHGSGIPQKDRDNIFDPFFRGSTSGEVRGTGIGLAIVQKISRTYGGKAWLEETPGGGCTFWVEMADIPACRTEALGS
ncbi:MAG: ATP-binding protein [Desulfuromonadales bacterium]|nr:ATP-binding protein [Desulfuromonadales bacterium]